jgi:hypothetical protein
MSDLAGNEGRGEAARGDELSQGERAELLRLRARQSGRRGARAWRWAGSVVVLLLAATLGSLAVAATYVRSEVLNTNTYVATVAPLATEPAVRDAVAHRLADEIVTRADVAGLARQLADQLTTRGAPSQLTQLVGPLVSGLNSLLYHQIYGLLGTKRFQTVWEDINRNAHQGLVTVLTGQQGQVVKSQGNTVTLDIGALLSVAKQQLVAQGLTIVQRVPDVSISYTLLESDQLPKIRRYTTILNTLGVWLPWLAAAALVAGVLIAPNRRRGLILAAALVFAEAVIFLAGLSVARMYYLDHLPSTVGSPDAVAEVYDTVLRFLVSALEALLAATAVAIVAAWLAGPSRPANWVRRVGNRALNPLAGWLARTGTWVDKTGRVLAVAYHPVQVGVILIAVAGLILSNRPSVAAVLWTSLIVLVVLGAVELLVRAGPLRPGDRGGRGGGEAAPA